VRRIWIIEVTAGNWRSISSLFYKPRSQKCKIIVKLSFFFALLGSACKKAALEVLVKLTPDDVFINFLTSLTSLFCQHLNLLFSWFRFFPSLSLSFPLSLSPFLSLSLPLSRPVLGPKSASYTTDVFCYFLPRKIPSKLVPS
jgi:hypothetical protein